MNQSIYCLIGNIPVTFHSADLRNYFATFVKEKKFDCFHFRHRPQFISISSVKSDERPNNKPDNNNHKAELEENNNKPEQELKKTFCALVRFTSEQYLASFIKVYHGKYWMDKIGNELQGRCIIQRVRLSQDEIVKFSKELHPPKFMPNGNVGTTNEYFLNLIKECRLPPSLIKKLGLEFPAARKHKKYSKVAFDYGTNVEHGQLDLNSDEDSADDVEVITGKGHQLSDISVPDVQAKYSHITHVVDLTDDSDKEVQVEEEENMAKHANDDDDNCEEWERHEALNNDVTSQERSKERLYEEEIELVWEKGGSGLLFYTDAQYWDEQRGGFDERTADDLDVDMDGYYEDGEGDKDARDLLDMRRSVRFRKGLEHVSVFKRKRSPSPCSSTQASTKNEIGKFEVHTRGIGRKVMENQGWVDGHGLGISTNKGIPEALDNEGQAPKDKTGFGYHGEKLIFEGKPKRPKHSNANNPYGLDEDDRVVIGTIYDKPNDLDQDEPLLRSNAPTFIKRYNFIKSKKREDFS